MVDLSNYISRCQFPSEGNPINCAVSGGADSVALMILAKYARCEVTVYHVNHNLRKESEADFVKELAERFELKFVSCQVTVAPGPNLEARAREKRFKVLPELVATGHTMDDQVETFFINLLRGSSLKGLSGMELSFDHPMLNLRRSETEAIVKSFNIVPFKDPSNSDLKYLRNKIRHTLIPMLNEMSNRDIVPVIARQMNLMRQDNEYLEQVATGVQATDVKVLRGLHKAISSRALRALLTYDNGYLPSEQDIDKVYGVVNLEHEATQIKNGTIVKRSSGKLKIEKQLK